MTLGPMLFSPFPVTQGHLHPPGHPSPLTEHSSRIIEAPVPQQGGPSWGVGVQVRVGPLNVPMFRMD